MFHSIPKPIKDRMNYLEEIDAHGRKVGTPSSHRLRQIPAESGRFLALLLANAPHGQVLEIGTSGGYSTLWLSLACRISGKRITTFEILENKARLARETFEIAQIDDMVELIEWDARQHIANYKNVAFCFLDTDKSIYDDCYETVIPNLVSGGLLVADNAISHQSELQTFIDRALNDVRVDALVVPVGKGLLVNRKI
jgi:predicted O-methyltransferase YrrM